MNNLVIIGNGFDLAHGLKTSYKEFIENINPNQIDILRNQFYIILKGDLVLKNWCDIERMYFKQLTSNEKYRFYTDPKKLNTEFEILKNYLAEYLRIQEKEAKPIEIYKELFKYFGSHETKILNFNYTNTLKNLYLNEIDINNVIHIHGELSNPINPIVFGYAAMDDESRNLIDKQENEYMRNIKKQLYKHAENEHLLSYYLNGSQKINVSILGHSCGISDKLILNQILNHKNINSICTYYFNDYEQYFQTQVNIDRIMMDDEKFRKLVIDYNNCIRMPQHDDTKKQNEDFIKKYNVLRRKQNDRLAKTSSFVVI